MIFIMITVRHKIMNFVKYFNYKSWINEPADFVACKVSVTLLREFGIHAELLGRYSGCQVTTVRCHRYNGIEISHEH